jgi:non-ribosomal peptide synthetase-like protein
MRVAGRSVEEVATELAEILADVLGVPEVSTEAKFFDDLGADSLIMAKFCARVRKRPDLPNVSIKDVYRWPEIVALAAGLAQQVQARAVESSSTSSMGSAIPDDRLAVGLAELLAEVLEVEHVPAEAHFFEVLGADSLVMAKFCARTRKRADLPNVAMKDIYRDPSIAALACSLADVTTMAALPVQSRSASLSENLSPASPAPLVPADRPAVPPVGRLQYFACGVVQALLLMCLPVVLACVMILGDDWLSGAGSPFDAYARAVLFGAGAVLASFGVPVIAKWLLIGRWKPTEIRLWSWGYLRFWVVKSLVQRNPLIRLLSGSPLLGLYLRVLGAKIGPRTTIFAGQIPVCTDLLTIGADTVIRANVMIIGYHAEAGVIRTGRITIGDRVVVGARSVLDVETRMGDDSQLGHSSALYPGQAVPPGERWYGCPAQQGQVDFRTVEGRARSQARRAVFGTLQVLTLVTFTIPLTLSLVAGVYVLPTYLTGRSWGDAASNHWSFYGYALAGSAAVFLGALVLAFPLLVLTSRWLSVFVRPGRVYPLHGWRHTALRGIARVTNMKFYGAMAADSSLVVHYLRAIGWRLKPYVQTGTNFGTISHDNPFAVSVGKGTVVADGFAVNNVEYSASTFRVTPVAIGAENFVGNNVLYPVGGRTGDNCLLATMVMVPTDGPVRQGVGLLGSPPFEIPRTVARDHGLAVTDPAAVRLGVRAKNRHNAISVLWFLLVRWFVVFAGFVAAEVAGDLHPAIGNWSLVLIDIGYAVLLFAFYVAVERFINRYATLAPEGVSIYDKAFWRHERYWKVPYRGYLQLFSGTPLKPVCWRLLGSRIGKRFFDESAGFVEKCYLSVGDFVTMNVASTVQNHSQEDGAFKSDRTHIASGVTVGVGAFVHYGITIEPDATIGAASFLMKGEQVPPGEYWGGNPAQAMTRPLVDPPGPIAPCAHPDTRAGRPRRRGHLIAYAATLAAAGTRVTLTSPVVTWKAVGALACLVALACLCVAAGRRCSHRGTDSLVPVDVQPQMGGVSIPRQAGPVEDLIVAVPTDPPSLTAGPPPLPTAELTSLPIGGMPDAWARLSAELDRVEELVTKWSSGHQ